VIVQVTIIYFFPDKYSELTQEEVAEEQVWMNLDLPKYLKEIIDPIDIPQDSVYASTISSLDLIKGSN